MEKHIFDLLARDGPWVLFVAQTLGIFGLPIPDELLLTLTGGMVRRGELSVASTVAAAVAGSVTGITLSYTLGRLGVRVLGHLPAIERDTIERGQLRFQRFGKWLLAFGCFVPGVRHVTAVAAGSMSLDVRTFCAYAYPGAALWSMTFVAIGYYAGAAHVWAQALLALRAHVAIVALLVLVLAAGYAVLVQTFDEH
jgi:membrane protein DedA with SNARE-associated domain